MIRHVVVFRWARGVTSAQIQTVRVRLSELPARIPEIEAYTFGPDAGIVPGNRDFALVADFASPEAFLTYRAHPDHQAVLSGVIEPLMGERVSVQLDLR